VDKIDRSVMAPVLTAVGQATAGPQPRRRSTPTANGWSFSGWAQLRVPAGGRGAPIELR